MITPRACFVALLAALTAGLTVLNGQSPIPGDFDFPGAANLGWTAAAALDESTPPRPTSHPARLVNLSSRAVAHDAGQPLIAGAAIAGSGSLPLLVRAVGPGLSSYHVATHLDDPALELFRGAASAARTTGFTPAASTVSGYVGAFPLVAGDPGDAALLGQAAPGTLTAHCSSASGASGVALVEFYDAATTTSDTSPRFSNLSTRARVEPGEGLIVLGFVIEGEGTLPLLLRGVGPTLGQFHVADTLADPAIELYSGNTRLAANDDWRSGGLAAAATLLDASRTVGAFDLASDHDAAMLVTLPAGIYTLLVRGAAGQSGEALAEIYDASAAAPTGFDAGRAINDSGLDLYRTLAARDPAQNLAISPYSIHSALSMTYCGAAGLTRAQMAAALHYPDDNATLQVAFAELRASLDAIAARSIPLAQQRAATTRLETYPIEWNAANRIFGQQDYPFRPSFLTLMSDGFAAPVQWLDFFRATEASRLTINDWVAEQTRQKISDLIPPGGVTEDTRLCLVNAIYLKAPWDQRFFDNDTTAQPFHPTPETVKNVPTMAQTASLGYTVEDGLTVVTLDYLGRDLQFVIILPDAGQTPETAAARLTPGHFARWAKLGTESRTLVALTLPKFKIEGAAISLAQALTQLGLPSAFDLPSGSADFDGIAPRRPDDYLKISDVFHKTFVNVDESGTEAAAATAVVVASVTSVGPTPVSVQVDRPFLFAIQHTASGACLFIGRVNDPE